MKINIDMKMCNDYRLIKFKFYSEYVPKNCHYNLKQKNILKNF